jgi:hypothetical protein
MWSAEVSEIGRRGTLRFAIHRDASAVTYADVLASWQTDPEFCGWFNDVLAGVPFAAFRWETPPVSEATSARPFEFVVLDSPALAREPTPRAFAEQFESEAADVLAFSNLGGDAIMIVPRPLADDSAYGHLGAFVRDAPTRQRLALWQAVGKAMTERLGAEPVWLSTAGAGVSWLHVRLDDRPKYYGFTPYRTPP